MIPTLSSEEQPLWNFFTEHSLTRPGFYPVCRSGDSASPLDSKFGGSVLHLPGAHPCACSECGAAMEVLLSVNLQRAPAAFRALFPAEHRDSLVQILYCTECMRSNEDGALAVSIFAPAQFAQLQAQPPREGAKIAPAVIERWEEFVSVDGTSDRYLELVAESGLDDLAMEEFVKSIRGRYAAKTHLLGCPYFQEGEYAVEGDDYAYLANFEDDANFSLMLGDAGVGQLWMSRSGNFNFTYM